ncbi:amino acid adenylation domain-containing protein [Parapedobacter indicus]|uniref:Amino acid adenylation domain-containing protein n=2 Tax=Parapedobacter indicus TaxID=1477437 RepID=A0A1I3QVF4_9SPHI|nr:amino acid adenylation domain-containing protein [Parapedobacter indicus]SFJ37499.1 amino acid adenylation domain-containing protein [Parapedobacter indicus]
MLGKRKFATLVDLFRQQVEKTPSRTAVVFNHQSLSYRELDERANQVAHLLIAKGVTQETLVAICLEKSLEMIVGMLAILKAGGAYVPIDPAYPEDRITYVLKDINASVVLTADESIGLFESISKASDQAFTILNLSQPDSYVGQPITLPESANLLSGDNLAYIIYTSGSTGRPKGVMISHRNVVRLFVNDTPLFDFDERDVWTMFHSFCFDFSVWEMYGALLFGGKLVIVPKNVARDASLFCQLLADEGVTILNQTPSAFYILQDQISSLTLPLPLHVRYVIFGGEALNPAKLTAWHERYPDCRLINMYGITETTVHVTYQEIEKNHLDETTSVIGKPIPTLYAYILDESLRAVPANTAGELFVGGDGLARGYLNLEQLTAERFIADPYRSDGAKLYRTGDLVKQADDGTLEYLGRIDEQVKVRGFRIELGEIEHAMQQIPEVVHGVVVAAKRENGDTQLIGYYVAKQPLRKSSINEFLRGRLPEYMVPPLLVEVDHIPLTSNGKVDKKALPIPDGSQLSTRTYVALKHKTERTIATCWKTVLTIERIGRDDNFFELGGNSLLAQKTTIELRKAGIDSTVINLYRYPTVRELARFLDGKNSSSPGGKIRNTNPVIHRDKDVAIIGMAGRFPGANTSEELWDILVNGKETIRFFSEEELDPSIPLADRMSPDYVKARGVIDHATDFDASFFGIHAAQAELMDPQHRVFLEICWEALEKTGYVPQKFDGFIGVYAGCAQNTYFTNHVRANGELLEKSGGMQVLTANDKDYLSSRVAYSLDLKGPAVTVLSACSTSLLAVAQAAESIRSGQCDLALAGGVSITCPINSGHLYEEGAMLSNDGHCRPFDRDARGTLFSDGAGVVVLKDKKQAEEDGDVIYAVIKGVGISNDGRVKGSFTAPNAGGQAHCIEMAIRDAQVDPADISYVETHGTATPLGDPIEIEGLRLAFGDQAEHQYCKIGSIKSNLGHLTHAAGVAGLIKVAMSLYHKKLPPSINYRRPNPEINFEESPFVVNDQLSDWLPRRERRIAGVSSFGVGGTNVHVVLEEHDTPTDAIIPAESGKGTSGLHVINLSAKSETSLQQYAHKLAVFLDRHPGITITDIAYTLQQRREDLDYRSVTIVSSASELVNSLRTYPLQIHKASRDREAVAFLFPGQGSQFPNMGKELYALENVYREAIDECSTILFDILGEDIRKVIFVETIDPDTQEKLRNTKYAQPALFITEYALAKLWMSWGVLPTAFIGHSIGEFVAAHLAGVFSLADALKLVAIRGRLIAGLRPGSMLSVRGDASHIAQLMPTGISMAAINAPSLCVVAGETPAIRDFSIDLDAQGIANKLLETSHAFHSDMMEPVLEAFRNVFEGITLRTPNKPIVSTVTGTWLKDEEATDADYWVRHVQATVRFSDALLFIEEELNPIFLEVGPGAVTATLARQHGSLIAPNVISGIQPVDALRNLYAAIGKLWIAGIQPDWDRVNRRQGKLAGLPTYAFDRKRHWLSPKMPAIEAPVETANNGSYKENMTAVHMNRKTVLIDKVRTLLEDAAGIEINPEATHSNFAELGLDSLLLTQVALSMKREFGVPVTFRGLSQTYATLDSLAEYLDQTLEPDAYRVTNTIAADRVVLPVQQQGAQGATDLNAIQLISQQIALLSQQVSLLQQGTPPVVNAVPADSRPRVEQPGQPSPWSDLTAEETSELKKPFGATARIEKKASMLTSGQQAYLDSFVARYTEKTGKSKSYTQEHRQHMADPRVVSGFKPETKEIVYPIVVNKSKDCRLWDIDGNVYIDALNGFGSNFLGYQPEAIKQALIQQVEEGYEIGPQHEKSGEVCKLICEFTGFDRAALCNTGSEAVLGAMRIARTVTGRSTIVAFTNSYHGIMDEVIARGTKKLKTFPAAPGIMPEAVQNMLILDYGTEESLQIIRERAHELAAVLVEPIQSRRPEFVPVEFLRELREITAHAGTALIFDEVISGFRFHPQGAQGLFDIQADIATYGKVAGAGISIGIIAGTTPYMDALDGGFWSFGDDSAPEAGVTYFAGTFVRHPLALATTKASLEYLKEQGPQLQETVNKRTKTLVDHLNRICERYRTPLYIAHFGSLWKVKYREEYPYSELLFAAMRLQGIHIQDGFPCFLTTAHTDGDIEAIAQAFEASVKELVEAGFIPTPEDDIETPVPPTPNARLGKDRDGNPAWFVADEKNPGKYLQVITD